MAVLSNTGIRAGASAGGGTSDSTYRVKRSARFNDDDSAYLSWTPSSAGNRRTWTWSGWVKRGNLPGTSASQGLFSQDSNCYFRFSDDNGGDSFRFVENGNDNLVSNRKFRDPSAWYHVVVAVDSTQGTDTNRVKVYINNEQITSWATSDWPGLNHDFDINNAASHQIARCQTSAYFDGLMADIHFIDGQQLAATDFAQADETTGQWVPKKYTGTYGTNGFHLAMDPTKSNPFGDDSSGNGNDWTANNLIDNSGGNGVHWSGNLAASNGYQSGNPSTQAFDGNTGTRAGNDLSSGGGTLTYTGTINVGSSIEFLTGVNNTVTINGSINAGSASSDPEWVSYNSAVTVTSFVITAPNTSGYRADLFAVKVDGVILRNPWNLDLLTDTPGAPYDNSLNGGGNYCTYNPLHQDSGNNTGCTLSNGNLKAEKASGDWQVAVGTMRVSSGKWYWENTVEGNDNCMIGITKYTAFNGGTGSQAFYYSPDVYVYYPDGAPGSGKINGNTFGTYGSTASEGDIIATCLDMDNGDLSFYKNGTSLGDAYTDLSGSFAPIWGTSGTAGATKTDVNFGQRPFAYTPPEGYKALNVYNLTDPDEAVVPSDKAFDIKLYEGTGSDQAITGLKFKPDLVWIKVRTQEDNHLIADSVRTAGKQVYANLPDTEGSDTNRLKSFDSTGFTVGTTDDTNEDDENFASYVWNAGSAGGSTLNDASSTGIGSIDSTYRVNTGAGFSIVSFNSGGSGNQTIAHALNAVPKFIINKNLDSANNWTVYHAEGTGKDAYLVLSDYPAVADNDDIWGTADPTSTVFGFESGYNSDTDNDCIAYCWSEVAGYSKFSTYEGTNSSDGTFVWCGFRPRWLLIKGDVAGEDWCIIDADKETYNDGDDTIIQFVNDDDTEYESSAYQMDILSNGFKLRNTNARFNQSNTYIFAAFAESPFKYANAR